MEKLGRSEKIKPQKCSIFTIVVDAIRMFLKKRSEMLLTGSVFVVFLLIVSANTIRLSAGAIRELADSLIVFTDRTLF